MQMGFTTAAYVVAAVLFILSLGGLSGQESAKRAVWYGIAGMALAVVATLLGLGGVGLPVVIAVVMLAAGGLIGAYAAKKVQMTEMPQLVAAMHSLVGLAAVFIGFQVIWNVSHSLHTPLMAVTNAISSIIILGALMQIGSGEWLVVVLAALSVFMAGINIFGGFMVTRRMLAMFQKS